MTRTRIVPEERLRRRIHERAQHAVFVRLHRMRRRRNEFMYEAALVSSESDLQQARRYVSELVSLARHAVEHLG
jgi:hypothetical protein